MELLGLSAGVDSAEYLPAGIRTTSGFFIAAGYPGGGSLSAYAGRLRLGVTATPAGLISVVTTSSSWGLAVEVDWRPIYPSSLFASQSVIRTRGIRTVGGDFAPAAAGSTQTNVPR